MLLWQMQTTRNPLQTSTLRDTFSQQDKVVNLVVIHVGLVCAQARGAELARVVGAATTRPARDLGPRHATHGGWFLELQGSTVFFFKIHS